MKRKEMRVEERKSEEKGWGGGVKQMRRIRERKTEERR